MNADERRFVASAFISILEADLAKDAVRLQADAGYDRTLRAACLGRGFIGICRIIDHQAGEMDF